MRIHQDHDHDHHTMLHRHHDVDDGGRGEEMLARRGPQSRESCPTRLNVLQLFLRILKWVPCCKQWVFVGFIIVS